MKWLKVNNKSDSESEILIDGVIGDFWQELDSQSIRDKINSAKGENLTIKVFSGGGSFFVGQLFYNLLKESGKKIQVINQGLVASAATFISCAGVFKMPRNANFMIHNPYPSNGTAGDANKLRAQADKLDILREGLLEVYISKTSLGREQLIEMMDAETWLTAEDALKYGFVDEILDYDAQIDNMAFAACVQSFKNMPQGLLNNVKSNNKPVQEGVKPMDLTQFKADHSAIADQFKAEILAANQTAQQEAIKAERKRVLDIQNTAFDGQEQLVQEAIENGTDAGQFAIAAAQAYKQSQAAKANTVLNNLNSDANQVPKIDNAAPQTDAEAIAAKEKAEKAKEDEFFADFGDLAKGIK